VIPPGGHARGHRFVVAVAGPSTSGDEQAAFARAVGKGIAEQGAALVCNGCGGIAASAAEGAKTAGGLTIGLLPGASAAESAPNASIELALFTGLGDGSAAVMATAADGLIAIGGGFGTLAQIGLFLRLKKPVVLLGSWRFAIDDIKPNVPQAETAAEAVKLIWESVTRG
jgi:uncharacterized protein (TIGR00725 family)